MDNITLYSIGQIAQATGKHPRWLNKISNEFINLGVAQRVGKILVFLEKEKTIKYVISRPETRGREGKTIIDKYINDFLTGQIKP